MKHFLVPTDFSDKASSAVNYAVRLAQHVNASITLFNCVHVPVFVGDEIMTSVPFDEIEKDTEASLNKLKESLLSKFPRATINTIVKVGFSAAEIISYTEKNNFDLIVMGITGAGKIDRFFGSTSTAVSKKSKVPVLIVPAESQLKKLDNIVFALDFKEIENPEGINIIIELAKKFGSNLIGLNIREYHQKGSHETSLSAHQAETLLSELPHRIVSYPDSSPVEGLEHYLEDHEVDMLVMLKRKHRLFDLLVNGSNTHKMAFHTHIPLLILHED